MKKIVVLGLVAVYAIILLGAGKGNLTGDDRGISQGLFRVTVSEAALP